MRRGLGVLVVDAGVADVRGGHDDDLAVVGGVGQRLLVAGHAGGEDGLAEGLPHRAVGAAAEGAAVLQDEYGGRGGRPGGGRHCAPSFRRGAVACAAGRACAGDGSVRDRASPLSG